MKNIILSNLRLKLLALAFASALWFFVAGQSKTEIGFLIPLGFKGVPKDMVMTGALPGEAEVRVSGPKLFINNLSPSQIMAELDLSGAKEGLNSYRLTPGDVVTPMGIEVLRLRPNTVDVKMERLVRVTLPVRVRLNGRPASGYRVSSVHVTPKAVSASGVRKDMSDLGAIYTKPVDVTGLSSSAGLSVPLDISHEFRSISEDSVSVKLIIEKER